MKRHRWRLLFPTSDTVPKLPPDARWRPVELPKQRKRVTELRHCQQCKKFTQHVVIETKRVGEQPDHKYGCLPCLNTRMEVARSAREKMNVVTSKRQEEGALLKWSALLAGMWTRDGAPKAREAIERIFSSERVDSGNKNLQQRSITIPGELYTESNNPNSTLGALSERPAIRIARNGFRFERRDLLDLIAWTIFKAKYGWLRRCKSHCSAPLFVAAYSRETYCFGCRAEAEKSRKRRWATKNRASKGRASKHRQRAA